MEACSSMWQPWRILALTFSLLLLLVIRASAGRHSQTAMHIAESTDAAVELYRDNFVQTLGSQPVPYAVVEFFANWCEQKYKPQYERVARLFNGPSAPYPGYLYMAKVDCALQGLAAQANRGLCDQFEIRGYPTLYWGRPYELSLGKGSSSDTVEIEGVLENSDKLLEWITKRSGWHFAFRQSNQLPQDPVDNVLMSQVHLKNLVATRRFGEAFTYLQEHGVTLSRASSELLTNTVIKEYTLHMLHTSLDSWVHAGSAVSADDPYNQRARVFAVEDLLQDLYSKTHVFRPSRVESGESDAYGTHGLLYP